MMLYIEKNNNFVTENALCVHYFEYLSKVKQKSKIGVEIKEK